MYLTDVNNYDKIKKIIGIPTANDITFIKKFSNQGKQGIVGVVDIKGQ